MMHKFFTLFTFKQKDDSNLEDLILLHKAVEDNSKLLSEIGKAIEVESVKNREIITIVSKKKNKFLLSINIFIILIGLVSSYISIETYQQLQRMRYKALNTNWSIDLFTASRDDFDQIRIVTADSVDDVEHKPPYEIEFSLGELSYLTGTMTIIDHQQQKILHLLIRAEDFQIKNILFSSKLYVWEFIQGVPKTKDIGLSIKVVNDQTVKISGFDVINRSFKFRLPNSIVFTNNSKIEKGTYEEDNYKSIVIDLFGF